MATILIMIILVSIEITPLLTLSEILKSGRNIFYCLIMRLWCCKNMTDGLPESTLLRENTDKMK